MTCYYKKRGNENNNVDGHYFGPINLHIPVTNPKCKCKEEDGGCFNKLDWYIKISISVDGDIWHELKPKTEPTRGTEILTGIIDIPKYIMEQSTDGNLQFKFTQNIKQCICCDDLFIRLVKPLREGILGSILLMFYQILLQILIFVYPH